jgi:nucleotide-binding universal stress UspA family protein
VGFLAPPDVGLGSLVTLEEARRAAKRETDRARRVAEEGAKLVSELFPNWSVHVDSPARPAYAAIVETAESRSADLVVVGSHGRGVLGRMMFGNVAQNVLAHCPCSVRIGRGLPPNSTKPLGFPPRVLVAVDGSPGSVGAVGAVCARNWPVGTEVRLATASDLRLVLALIDMGVVPADVGLKAGGGSPVEKVMRAAGDRFRESALSVSTVLLEGDPKRELLREAEEWGADCIFLGAKGHTRLERFFIGSVSASIAARAGCSVEVIRNTPC